MFFHYFHYLGYYIIMVVKSGQTKFYRLLDNNNLSGDLPPQLSQLPNLQILYVCFSIVFVYLIVQIIVRLMVYFPLTAGNLIITTSVDQIYQLPMETFLVYWSCKFRPTVISSRFVFLFVISKTHTYIILLFCLFSTCRSLRNCSLKGALPDFSRIRRLKYL